MPDVDSRPFHGGWAKFTDTGWAFLIDVRDSALFSEREVFSADHDDWWTGSYSISGESISTVIGNYRMTGRFVDRNRIDGEDVNPDDDGHHARIRLFRLDVG